jgi:hypothetical protein
MNFISGYCRIHHGKISTPGSTTNVEALDFHDLLQKVYDRMEMVYPKFYKMDAQSKLGLLAAEELLRDLPMNHYLRDQVAVALSNADASLDTDLRYQATLKQAPSPSAFVYTLSNIAVGELCIRHGFQGENAFFVSPSFDADWMTTYVELIMGQDQVQACVSGWLNVLGDQYDVFLYLVEKQKRGLSVIHTAEALTNLYR